MELTAGSTRLRIDESFGARLASLQVAGPDGAGPLELVGHYQDSPHGWGCFPMAPWAGRVRAGELTWRGTTHQLPLVSGPHAIHGTVARVPWQVVQVEQEGEGRARSSATLGADLGADWPWPGTAVLHYDLGEGELRTRLEVRSAESPMPAWVGLHPWFPRRLGGVAVEMGVQARAMLGSREEGIPSSTEVPLPEGPPEDAGLNDTLADVSWPVTLTWPGVARLEVEADTPWAVVFTQRDAAVCVEPQSAPPDAAALGLEGVAEPGSPVAVEMTWRWQAGGPPA